MKKQFALALALTLVFSLAGCGEKRGTPQGLQDKDTLLLSNRFDQQEEVFYLLADQIECYIVSERSQTEEAKFQALCAGINCAVHNDSSSSLLNSWYEGNDALIDTLRSLFGFTTLSVRDKYWCA